MYETNDKTYSIHLGLGCNLYCQEYLAFQKPRRPFCVARFSRQPIDYIYRNYVASFISNILVKSTNGYLYLFICILITDYLRYNRLLPSIFCEVLLTATICYPNMWF